MRVLIQNNVSAGQLFLSLISIVHWQQGANADKTEFDDYLPCLKKDQHVYFNGGSEVLTLTKPDEDTPTFVTRVYDNDAVTDSSQSGIAVEFPLQVHSPYYYNGSGAEPEPNNSSEATNYFIINDVLTCTAQHLSITEFAQHITDQEVIANRSFDYIDYAQMHMHEWVTTTTRTSTVVPTVSIYSLGDSATGTPSTSKAPWTSDEDTCTQRRKLDIQIPKTWWQETPTSHASMKIVFPGTNFPENRVYQNFLVSCKLELGNTGADGSTALVQYGKKEWVVVLKQMSDWTTTNQLTDNSLSVDAMPLIQRNEIVQAGVINPEDTSILKIGVALSQFEQGSGGFTAISTAPVRADTVNRISWDFTTSLQKSHFDKLKKFFISWKYYESNGTLTTGVQKMYELDVAGWVPTSTDPDSLNNPLLITDMSKRLCSCTSLSECDADARCDADTAFTTEKDVSTDNWYLDFWMGPTFKDNLQTQKKYWASLDADAQDASPLTPSTYNQIGVSITVEARYSTIASDRTNRRRANDTGGNRSFTMEFTIVDDSPVEVDDQGSNALDSSAACLASSLASMTGAIVCAAIVIA